MSDELKYFTSCFGLDFHVYVKFDFMIEFEPKNFNATKCRDAVVLHDNLLSFGIDDSYQFSLLPSNSYRQFWIESTRAYLR